MTSPKVTIGITSYNAVDTIGRAIASALAQDLANVEIVVVDDCSIDGSVVVIEEQLAGCANARLVRHDVNKGPGAARATVLQEARGDYVAFIDDDDEALPSRMRTQLETLQIFEAAHGTKLVACYASGERRYDSGYVLALEAIGSRGAEAPHGDRLADFLLFGARRPDWFYGSGTPACSLMAPREALLVAGGFDPSLRRVEDVDLAIRLALKGGHFIGTTEPLFLQYATAGGDKSPERNRDAEQYLADKYKDYLSGINRYHYAKQWPQLRYWHFKRNYLRFLAALAGLCFRYPIAVPSHLLTTGPRRLVHERRMAKGGGP